MVKVKICGLKTVADVEMVNQYLPDYIGFVFAKTKRFVSDEEALVMKQVLDKRIKAVGVFVDEPIAHVESLCYRGIIDAVQLHGAESEEYIRALKDKTDITVIKAVKVQSARQVLELLSQEADFMLFDTYKKGELGGTGERFPLHILQEGLYKAEKKGVKSKPYFLAGGLDSEHVSDVLAEMAKAPAHYASCYAVDVSTGVETDGVKDENKVKQFIQVLKTVDKTL